MELISEGMDKINGMKARELERQLNLQRKQQDKKSIIAENEQMEFFERTFNEKHNFIENLLIQSRILPKNELPEHFNVISKEILLLQKYVAASNLFLRNYFIKKCQNSLHELSNKASALENELIPKKKFGFKNKPVKIQTNNNYDAVDSSLLLKGTFKKISLIECGFFNKSNEILTLSHSEIAKKDVSMENLENCQVYLKGYPSTLHLNHLTNCQVFSGPVSTSIFAENCKNCTLIISCQQLRLHSSNNVKIYLQVTSRAIMEDCKEILVAPYNWHYVGIENDFLEAGLNRTINNWRSIDDFNWLNAEKRSPHWRELNQEEIVENWN